MQVKRQNCSLALNIQMVWGTWQWPRHRQSRESRSRATVQDDGTYTVTNVDTSEMNPPRLRWVGNGRTVLNNKGNPVKQYEPYFSVIPHYEDAKDLVENSVTPILYYDSLGRLIRTELPDNTFSKVEFDSWSQTGYDQNDTVMDSKWYSDRISGAPSDPQTKAAEKAAKHHNTPSTTHADTLGRPILTVEHNRDANDDDLFYNTIIEMDIEGNVRKVIDARGKIVMEYKYDMLGHRVYQNSMDGGDNFIIADVAGQPLMAWDANENGDGILEQRRYHTIYDYLRRPLQQRLYINNDEGKVIERFKYGEGQPSDKSRNLRGQLVQHYDSSGLMTNQDFDFKGNLLKAERQFAVFSTESLIHWPENPDPNTLEEAYTQNTLYDSLNRMIRQENWHIEGRDPAVYTPRYDERGLLAGETLSVRGQTTEAISNITHDAKGQRNRIQYGNGTTTRYTYDPETFRLIQLRTTKTSPGESLPTAPSNLRDLNVLQNIYYSYDPIGNITEIHDDAYEPVFFNNQQVEARSRYTYDALYRLIEAKGRESVHAKPPTGGKRPETLETKFAITDKTLRNYTQTYVYDSVGNIKQMQHVATNGNWTRHYEYEDDSNRLKKTRQGTNIVDYQYDTHGSILNFNNVANEYRLHWDSDDMIHHVNLGGGGDAYYDYGSDKERSRKRIINDTGTIIEERLYLGGMERYRRWVNDELKEEIETYHLFDGEQRVLMVENVLLTDNPQNLKVGVLYRYQYSNHLGSVGLEVDEVGSVISYEEYHPYGTTAFGAKDRDIKAAKKRYRYTGMERDEESGLSYHSARYYLPWLGRWGSSDPIGLGGGINLYAYSSNNPINNNDPSGLDDKEAVPSPPSLCMRKCTPTQPTIGVDLDQPEQRPEVDSSNMETKKSGKTKEPHVIFQVWGTGWTEKRLNRVLRKARKVRPKVSALRSQPDKTKYEIERLKKLENTEIEELSVKEALTLLEVREDPDFVVRDFFPVPNKPAGIYRGLILGTDTTLGLQQIVGRADIVVTHSAGRSDVEHSLKVDPDTQTSPLQAGRVVVLGGVRSFLRPIRNSWNQNKLSL